MRCPVCRATAPGPQCRRCKADLSVLFALEEQRSRALEAARWEMARGACAAATVEAARAQHLRSDREVGGVRAAVQLLQRDFVGAWQAYRRLSSSANAE